MPKNWAIHPAVDIAKKIPAAFVFVFRWMTIVAKNAIKEKIKGVKPNIEFAIIIWDAAFFIELQDVRQGVKIINKINLFIFNVIANSQSKRQAVGQSAWLRC